MSAMVSSMNAFLKIGGLRAGDRLGELLGAAVARVALVQGGQPRKNRVHSVLDPLQYLSVCAGSGLLVLRSRAIQVQLSGVGSVGSRGARREGHFPPADARDTNPQTGSTPGTLGFPLD